MNQLQKFIAARPFGFITEAELPALVAMDRLCPLLVRCGACRFTCAAQDTAHLIRAVELAGDYIRDVSFPVGSIEAAAHWAPAPLEPTPRPATVNQAPLIRCPEFDESERGGVFDGNSVSSDADPGL